MTESNENGNISTYTYDVLGNPLSYDNDLYYQTYTYDSMNRLVSTSVDDELVEYTYDANSNLLRSARNGNVYSETEYNAANLPVVTKFITNEGVEDLTRYTYNPDGNLAMSMGMDTSSMYYYDGANRLVYENTWGDGIGYDDRYTYDSFGNRTGRAHRDYYNNTSENNAYTYNSINQLVSKSDGLDTVTFAYDTVGNMTAATKNGNVVKQYTYDLFNRLKTANVNGNSASYTYNGDNLRQSKTVNGVTTQHLYNGSDIVADMGTSDTIYARGLGLAFIKDENGVMNYAITPRGDVAKLMNETGTTHDYTYSAYGEATGENVHTVNPFGYTGEYTDTETGLIYLRNRYYDPEIGRFLTEDTYWNVDNMIYGDDKDLMKKRHFGNVINYKKLSRDDIINLKLSETTEHIEPDINAINQSSNLYIYAMCNPNLFIDPSGERVTGYGITGSASLLVGYEGQILWVVDDKGNFALMTVNGGISSIGLSLGGVVFSFPDMPNIYEMAGQGFGISINNVSGNSGGTLLTSGDYVGIAYSAGIGGEVDVSVSADVTYTTITPINGNLNSIGGWLKNAINTILPKDWEI